MKASPKKEEAWILRFVTNDCKYRLELYPWSTYQQVLSEVSHKTNTPIGEFELYSQNGRKLNIDPKRKLKDIIYLGHGSILKVSFPNNRKKSASQLHQNFRSSDSKITYQTELSPPKTHCFHSPQGKCLNCLPSDSNIEISPRKNPPNESVQACVHNANGKCLRCCNRQPKSPQKQIQSISTPQKSINPEINEQACRHRPTISCRKCINTPKKVKQMVMIKPSEIKQSKESELETKPEKEQRKCLHGESGKCLNCLKSEDKKNNNEKSKCSHGPEGKCFNCLPIKQKPPHIPFDEFLMQRKNKCEHSKDTQCLNCMAYPNLRLVVDYNCKKHPPYPLALCSACKPENVSIKTQQFRHVDYVQYMNQRQIQSFINYWLTQKGGKIMRVGFLYGYYAEDPYYPNGIRAIVEALYEPHQYCTQREFWILDSEERKENLQIVVESLGLEKIGIIIASPNRHQAPFTESQIRALARMQEKEVVRHATGYKLSNYFTVLVRSGKDSSKSIEPSVYMVSDQGQALQTNRMFVQNKQNPYKMKIKSEEQGVLLPEVYVGGKLATEFQIEYLLVKIASGMGKSSKYAILKSNLFPPSSRGPIKTEYLKRYIIQTREMSNVQRFGDLNLLLYISETINLQTVMEVGLSVAAEKEVEESLLLMIDKQLQRHLR